MQSFIPKEAMRSRVLSQLLEISSKMDGKQEMT